MFKKKKNNKKKFNKIGWNSFCFIYSNKIYVCHYSVVLCTVQYFRSFYTVINSTSVPFGLILIFIVNSYSIPDQTGRQSLRYSCIVVHTGPVWSSSLSTVYYSRWTEPSFIQNNPEWSLRFGMVWSGSVLILNILIRFGPGHIFRIFFYCSVIGRYYYVIKKTWFHPVQISCLFYRSGPVLVSD